MKAGRVTLIRNTLLSKSVYMSLFQIPRSEEMRLDPIQGIFCGVVEIWIKDHIL